MSRTLEQPNSVQVLFKAGAILDCLADAGELSAGRLAELTGEPRSTIYRLLATLQRLGVVESGSNRATYRLGWKLFRYGSVVLNRSDLRKAALPVMQSIRDETEQTVLLSIRRDYEAVCIERVEGRWVESLTLRVGKSLPLHVGAGPRALLAFETRDFCAEYLERVELVRFTSSTLTDPHAILRSLDEIRKMGYSVNDGEIVLGIAAIGTPIFDYTGHVCAALSLSGPTPAILGEASNKVRDTVVQGAAEISRALGFHPDVDGSAIKSS